MPDVVLVDGDDHYREVLSANLIALGFSVMCFAKGSSLLEALRNGLEPKVALLEWALPEASGVELLHIFRKHGIDLPVVFLTGCAVADRELKALAHGAVDFIDKARGIEVLAHRLRLLIDSQRPVPVAAMPEVERHNELALNPSAARALWLEHDVGLSIAEYKIVALLVSSKGKPQTYRAIYDIMHVPGFIAGSGARGYTINVRSIMKRIRTKFQAVDADFSAIKNVRLVGYQWLDRQN